MLNRNSGSGGSILFGVDCDGVGDGSPFLDAFFDFLFCSLVARFVIALRCAKIVLRDVVFRKVVSVFVAFAMGGSFFLVRRQALKAGEPFWSPPTRRVTQATLPPLAFGLFIGIASFVSYNSVLTYIALGVPIWLPIIWVALYGCAFHAAGFFMPRGMRVFGWACVIGSCAIGTLCLFTGFAKSIPDRILANGVMGFFFGVLHLAYGVYLYFTEPRRDET